MRAIVCRQYGPADNLVLLHVPPPEVLPGARTVDALRDLAERRASGKSIVVP